MARVLRPSRRVVTGAGLGFDVNSITQPLAGLLTHACCSLVHTKPFCIDNVGVVTQVTPISHQYANNVRVGWRRGLSSCYNFAGKLGALQRFARRKEYAMSSLGCGRASFATQNVMVKRILALTTQGTEP